MRYYRTINHSDISAEWREMKFRIDLFKNIISMLEIFITILSRFFSKNILNKPLYLKEL